MELAPTETPQGAAGGELADSVRSLFQRCLDARPAERERLLEDPDVDHATRLRTRRLLDVSERRWPALDGDLVDWAAPLLQHGLDEPMPARIGPYRILELLGRGGMGSVYLGERDVEGFRQRVAVKRIDEIARPQAIDRFLRERRILAGLNHPNIAALYDGGVEEDGRPYFSLEYVEGAPLTAWCEEHGAGLAARLDLYEQMLDAVSFAHRSFVVHLDLKPANVLVTREGRVKLLDFGISRLLGPGDGDASITLTRLLTPRYAAPEQILGERVSIATDIYSLGVILFELLAGELPYAQLSGPFDLPRAIVGDEPARLPRPARGKTRGAALVREVTRSPWRADLDQVIAHCLEKDPAKRYPSVEAMAADVRALREARPLGSRRASPGERAAKFFRRNRMPVLFGATTAVLAIAGVSATLWQASQARRESAVAMHARQFLTSALGAVSPELAKGREPTVREALDLAAPRIDSELAGQPEIQSPLLSDVGELYGQLGKPEIALDYLRRASALAASSPRISDTDRVLLDARLAYWLQQTGQIRDAHDVIKRAQLADRSDASLAARVELLLVHADVLHQIGDSKASLAALENATRRELEEPEATDAMRASVFNQIGLGYQIAGDYNAAIRWYEPAVAMSRTSHGETHPDTLSIRHQLATALMLGRGDFERAEAEFRSVLQERARVLGETHAYTNYGRRWWAFALAALGRTDEARALYRASLEWMRRHPDSPRTEVAGAYANRFHLWIVLDQPEAALRDIETAERIWTEQVPPGHEWLLNTRSQRGLALARTGRLDEGKRLIDEVVLARRNTNSPRIAPALAMQAEVSRRMRKVDLALAQGREAMALQTAIADHEPLLLPIRIGLAEILAASGDVAAAELELARVEKVLRGGGYSRHHPRLVQVHRIRAQLAQARGDSAGAQRQALDAERVLAAACDAGCRDEALEIAAGR